jgi:DNA-binding transcriptional ArsR family regulator
VAAKSSAADPFAALGDEHRRAIVEALAAGERSVSEIARELPISRPAVSRHLKLLKGAGLVSDRAEGTKRVYSLDDSGVEAIQNYMLEMWGDAVARFRIAVENTEGES